MFGYSRMFNFLLDRFLFHQLVSIASVSQVHIKKYIIFVSLLTLSNPIILPIVVHVYDFVLFP